MCHLNSDEGELMRRSVQNTVKQHFYERRNTDK